MPVFPEVVPRRLVVVGSAVVATVVLWLLWLARFRGWIAHNDHAVLQLNLERQLDGDLRLVGAHSRLGVQHPGPLREWVFTLPYAVSGRRMSALPATAMVLNVWWAVWIGSTAVRLAGAARVVALAGLVLVVVALGGDLASPWNPHLAVLPTYLAAWGAVRVVVSGGRHWVAPVAAASFAGQLHGSALPSAGVLLLVVLVAAGLAGWRPLAGAAGLAVALWSGPLLDLRHGADANLVRLATEGSNGPRVPVGDALAHVSRLLWPATPVTGDAVHFSEDVLVGFSRVFLVAAVGVLAAGVAARWRDPDRWRRPAWVAPALALVLLAVSVASIAAFPLPPYRYLYGPLQAVAVFASSALVLAVADARRWAIRPAWPTVVTGTAAAAVGLVVVLVPADDHETAGRRALAVELAVDRAIDEHPGWDRVEVLGLDEVSARMEHELAVVADRRGLDVRSTAPALELPAPDGGEPILVAAMGSGRTCLLDAVADGVVLDGVELLVDGVVERTGEEISVVVVEPGAAARTTCLGRTPGT